MFFFFFYHVVSGLDECFKLFVLLFYPVSKSSPAEEKSSMDFRANRGIWFSFFLILKKTFYLILGYAIDFFFFLFFCLFLTYTYRYIGVFLPPRVYIYLCVPICVLVFIYV